MTAPRGACIAGSTLLLLIAAAVGSGAAAAEADPLPPGIRACAAQADALARLECYDREVGRLAALTPPAPVVAVPGAKLQPPAAAASPGPPPAPAAAQAVPALAGTAAAVNPPATPAPSSPAPAQHLTARVVKVDHYGDQIVVHLDNGQTWQQAQPPNSDLNLHAGDTVTLDRQLGSWWLSIRAATMQVRLRP